jgi:hypothetical protein
MAVGMLLAGESATKDAYVQVTEKMFGSYPMREDQSPEGLIVHTAGQAEQGWYVYDIWESQEHFQQFVESKLRPALQDVVPEGAPHPEPQFYPIEVMVKGSALASV